MNKAIKFWDKQASRYDQGEQRFESVYKKVLARTTSYIRKDDIVLDFGCATGTKSFAIARSAKEVYGLDISSEMVKEANKKKQEINNIEFLQGTIFDTGFSNESFDAVVSFAVIHLLDNNKQVMQRIYDLLKPGGFFISTTPCLKEKMERKTRLQFSILRFLKKMGLFPLDITLFTISDVESLISDQDFQIIEKETIFDGMTAVFIVAKK